MKSLPISESKTKLQEYIADDDELLRAETVEKVIELLKRKVHESDIHLNDVSQDIGSTFVSLNDANRKIDKAKLRQNNLNGQLEELRRRRLFLEKELNENKQKQVFMVFGFSKYGFSVCPRQNCAHEIDVEKCVLKLFLKCVYVC